LHIVRSRLSTGRHARRVTLVSAPQIWRERTLQRRHDLTPDFTSRCGCNRLVFRQRFERMDEAIARETQIKGDSRAKKIALIEAINPDRRRSVVGRIASPFGSQ
jgi:predicted GIY-YIG superfamily endonuclease